MSGDVNAIIRAYLAPKLSGLVGSRLYCPRLPEGAGLPAVGFFVRGGGSTPYVPPLVNPSVQFDCWGRNPIEARSVYSAVYAALQGIQNQTVTVGGIPYRILSGVEEVQGMELQEVEFPNYHRVLTFFRVQIQI